MPGADRSPLGRLMIVRVRVWKFLRSIRDRASPTCRRLSPTVTPRQAAREPASEAHTAPPACLQSVHARGTAQPLWQGSESQKTSLIDQVATSCRASVFPIPVKPCAATDGQSHPLKREL